MLSQETFSKQKGMNIPQRQQDLLKSKEFENYEGKLSPPTIMWIYKYFQVVKE